MREIVRNDQVAGEVRLHAIRKSAAYGPGDAVELYVEIHWDGEQAIKVRVDFISRFFLASFLAQSSADVLPREDYSA